MSGSYRSLENEMPKEGIGKVQSERPVMPVTAHFALRGPM